MSSSYAASVSNVQNPQQWGVQSHHRDWVADFVATNGRTPTILGIGNIANNAFKNALALRANNIQCDVLCYDYYHIMGCPEWEAATFDTHALDDFRPNWSNVDLHGYQRPRWFAQGTLTTAVAYLIAFREGLPESDALWNQLARERDDPTFGSGSQLFSVKLTQSEIDESIFQIIESFDLHKHGRADDLNYAELNDSYLFLFVEKARLQRLFKSYDIVIGYSTDGIFPVVAGKKPFIAYEHGTIRTIPFEASTRGRLCNLTYRSAHEVLITNCDNIVAAEKLHLPNFLFVPHAILEQWCEEIRTNTTRTREIRDQYDTDFLIFHPARQHWSAELNPNFDKGNDILIRGFAKFVPLRPNAVLLMVDWGMHVEKSKALITELAIDRHVAWIRPKPVREMSELIAAADVLADQFVIGAWGAIMPLGMMFGKPTLIYLDESIHRWCFPELPPVLNANTPNRVMACLCDMLDQQAARALGERGREWYQRFHSLDVVTGRLLDACILALRNVESNPNGGEINDSVRQRSKIRRLEVALAVSSKRMDQLTQTMAAYDERLLAFEDRYFRIRRAVGPLLTVTRSLVRGVRIMRRCLSTIIGR